MLFGKVVSDIGSQSTFGKKLSKDDGVEKSSSTKNLITALKRPSKNRIQDKQYLEARQENSFHMLIKKRMYKMIYQNTVKKLESEGKRYQNVRPKTIVQRNCPN